MQSYLIRRAFTFALTLLLAATLSYLVLLVLPGDPARLMLGLDASPDALGALRRQLGLDRPVPVRYLAWLGDLVRGDLGTSLLYRVPVRELLASGLAVTGPLALGAMLLAALVAVPLGTVAAVRRGGPLDVAVSGASQVGQALPSFWLGLFLILIFSVRLGWLPAGGFPPWSQGFWGAAGALVLPALALAAGRAASMSRMVRASLADALEEEYVRTAKAKGLPGRRVVLRHGLRNGVIPVLTLTGTELTQLLAGSVVVENLFSLPGLGNLALQGIGARDLPLVQGVVLLAAAAVLLTSLVLDVLYAVLDPRIRYR
ncbi:ABC transporter permease [Limnochorda pilosa]|uniref:Peptide ABC transporter n=1 Tax=Limnochorda pilosa TaxID=1555112 RepID=A0A0K2SPH2_LIMPI|nr:ABC transporter permease [Limnochorda pilosa]BAS29038.1 peptide ABC transporter [Limnochorda pilosa]